MNLNQAIALKEWNRAVNAFHFYVAGNPPSEQEHRFAWSKMEEAAWDWCDRSLSGIRPVSPMAVAHGK